MRHLIKHLGIIHNDLAGSCLDLIINLVTTSGSLERDRQNEDRARSRRIAIGRVVGAHFLTECTKGGIVAGVDVPDLLLIGRGLLFVRFTFLF